MKEFSVYLTPRDPIKVFQVNLNNLNYAIRDVEGELIVAGDFNAKALEYGKARLDSRGKRVMDMVSRLELVILNVGSTSTFRRPVSERQFQMTPLIKNTR